MSNSPLRPFASSAVKPPSEVVIFCDAYPQIKNALYVAMQHKDKHRITVTVTGDRDLFQFLQLANEKAFDNSLQLVYLDGYIWRIATVRSRIAKAFWFVPDMIGESRYLARVFSRNFARFRGAEVFFFSRYFNASLIYLLRKLGRHNRLTFMPDRLNDALSMQTVVAANIDDLAYLARCKLVYGRHTELAMHPAGLKVPGLSDKFLQEKVDRIIGPEESNSMLQGFDLSQFKIFDVSDYSVAYFDEDLVEHDYVRDTQAYKKILDGVFQVLARHFPEDRVAIKYHPASTDRRVTVGFGRVLPDFVPAEFLYHDNVKMYLDFASMALANVERGLAVSLMDMVPLKDEETRRYLRDYLLRQSRSPILFPKSLGEFERIVEGIGGKTSP
ncbi:MAG: hypothetical protein HY673_17810 [Chloroflexi bacterium]|nr:hypothetical protein [Chloroflexota bacterium]